jgi:chemotaxis protein methyltransferase CheR
MTTEFLDDSDYAAFVHRVRRITGIDLNGYKPEQMRRRLLALAARHGSANLCSFAAAMERDGAALTAFKNFFTINVSEFLRDGPRWDDLAERVLPDLLATKGRKGLQVWSAGCSYGAEPYSLAMLLDELAPRLPHIVLATDIDETILSRAREGARYQENDLRNVSEQRRARFFQRGVDGTYAVNPVLKERIRFVRHDLLTDVPTTGLDLIICRNVVIYFTEQAKRLLYKRMWDALRPGGVLFVGGTEVVVGARELGLEPFLTSFYVKRAVGTTYTGKAFEVPASKASPPQHGLLPQLKH